MANIETSTDASRVLYLDTSQATDNLSGVVVAGQSRKTTDVSFQFQESIVVPAHHSILLSVHSASIPYSFYNFQVDRNITLTYRRTATGVVAGDEGGTTFKCSFNPSTLKCEWVYIEFGFRLTFQFRADQTTNFKEEIGFAPNSFVAGLGLPSTANGTGFNFWMDRDNGTVYTIGYDDGVDGTLINTATTPANINTGIPDPSSYFSVVDVNYHIRQLYLRTNITSHSVLDSSIGCRFSNILARIPISAISGGELRIAPSDGAVHTLMLKVREITRIFLRLTDKDNKLIDLNGLDFSIALQFDFVETPTIVVPIDKREKINAKQYHAFLKSQGKAKVKELKEFEEEDANKKFLSV